MSGVGLLVLGAALMVGMAAFQTGTSFVFMASGAAWAALGVAWAWSHLQGRGAWILSWGSSLLCPAHEAGLAWAQLSGPPGRKGVLLCPTGLEATAPPWLWFALPGRNWRTCPFVLDAQGQTLVAIPLPAGPRSSTPLPPLWRLAVDPWGLMPRLHALPCSEPLALHRHPQALAPYRLPWLDSLVAAALGQASQSLAGGAMGLRGLRPHRQGDPLKAVHWRTTARLGGIWHVRETESEAMPRVRLFLDRQASAHLPQSFESMAAGAAALAAYAAQRGWPCVLQAEGLADSGPSLSEALTWLAKLTPAFNDAALPELADAVVLGPRPPLLAAAWVATPKNEGEIALGAVANLHGLAFGDGQWQGQLHA